MVKFSLFSLYERFRVRVGSDLLAGGMAGAMNAAISCPSDLLKSQVRTCAREVYERVLCTDAVFDKRLPTLVHKICSYRDAGSSVPADNVFEPSAYPIHVKHAVRLTASDAHCQ